MSRKPDTLDYRRAEFLSFSPSTIGEEEILEVERTLRSGWLTTGERTARFEEEFARKFSTGGALAVNSCTAAMHLALKALGVGPGDEVVTSTMTFAATANVIVHVGATPILVDVEPDTLNIRPDAVAAAITPRTKAVMPVHYAGHPAEMDAIADICGDSIHIVEDAAHAVGARYRGRTIGSGENLTAFSFYATKNLSTGEGGLLAGPGFLLERPRVLALHGMNRDAWARYEKGASWYYEILEPGFKYNMSDVLASIGLAQLRRFDDMQARRLAIVQAYWEGFKDLDALELPVSRPHVDHAWHLFVLRLRLERLRIDRRRFIEELTARNIGASVHFIPVHAHPYYAERFGYAAEDLPDAFAAYNRMLSLPLSPALSDGDVEDVISAVSDIVAQYRR